MPLGNQLIRQGFNNLGTQGIIQLDKRGIVEGIAQQLDEIGAVFRTEGFNDIAQIRLMQILRQTDEKIGIARFDGIVDELEKALGKSSHSHRAPAAIQRRHPD